MSQPEPTNRKQLRDALQAAFPHIAFSTVANTPEWQPQVDVSKLENELGVHQTPTFISLVDQARSQLALGLVQPKLRANEE